MLPSQSDDLDAVIKSNPPIVIDNGSGVMKAGFAQEERPSLCFGSFVGRPKHQKILGTSDKQDLYIGKRAEENRGLLRLSYPIQHGVVKNKHDMGHIWNHIFLELKASPQQHPILLSQAPQNPVKNRQDAATFFFQSLNVPAIFFATQGVLSLYSVARQTGIVLDCGDGVTHVVPIFEGYKIPSCITRVDLAGRDISNHLQLLLRRSGYNFTTSAQFQIVKKIKQSHCYVQEQQHSGGAGISGLQEKKSSSSSSYFLPDGSQIKLKGQMSQAPQILFKPDKVGLELPGVHELVYDTIQKTDIDLRKTLCQNVLLTGGTTLFPGFAQRIFNHLKKKLSSRNMKVILFQPNDRQLSCWFGGSIVSSLASFKSMWITKNEYKEHGDKILSQKTF